MARRSSRGVGGAALLHRDCRTRFWPARVSAGFASALAAARLAKISRPDVSPVLRHCAGVRPMWLLKARWKAASD